MQDATNPAMVAVIVFLVFFFEFSLVSAAFFFNDKRFSDGEVKILVGVLFGAISIVAIFIGAVEAVYRWPILHRGYDKFMAVIESRAKE